MDDFGRTQRVLDGGPRVRTNLRTHNFSLLGKVILPTLGPLQPYMKGGIGFLNVDGDRHLIGWRGERSGSDTEFSGRLDGGLDYLVTPHVALNADVGYVMPTEALFPLNYLSLSLGAQYRF
jgi:opacity protein-like surface antigen